MLVALDEKLCEKCPHQVIAGVACDWRPSEECPYLLSEKTTRQPAYRAWVPLAMASETDAIRGID